MHYSLIDLNSITNLASLQSCNAVICLFLMYFTNLSGAEWRRHNNRHLLTYLLTYLINERSEATTEERSNYTVHDL